MNFWMSPWRQGTRDSTPCLIADLAPSKAEKKQSKEVVIPLDAVFLRLNAQGRAQFALDRTEAIIKTFQETP